MLFLKSFAFFALLAAIASVQAVTMIQLHTHALVLQREDPQKLQWAVDMMWREHMGYFNPKPIAIEKPTEFLEVLDMTGGHSLQNLVHDNFFVTDERYD